MKSDNDIHTKGHRRHCFLVFDPLTFVIFIRKSVKVSDLQVLVPQCPGTRETFEILPRKDGRRIEDHEIRYESQGTENLCNEVREGGNNVP